MHESALHHASRRSGGCGEGIPPEGRDAVSLPRLRPHRVSKTAGRDRDRSPVARMVSAIGQTPAVSPFGTRWRRGMAAFASAKIDPHERTKILAVLAGT